MLHYDTHLGLTDLQATVDQTVRALRPHLGEFDSIAVQGTSGILIGSPVALALGKPLVIIRADEDMKCHHNQEAENARNAGTRILFLDDQISSGRTLRDVRRKLQRFAGAKVVASYLYQTDDYDREGSIPEQLSLSRRDVPRQRESSLYDYMRGSW